MNKLYAWALGLSKSKTITFAVMLAIAGAVQMYVDVLRPLFHTQQAFGWFCMGLAVIVGILRAFTYQSLTDKGAATDGTLPPSG